MRKLELLLDGRDLTPLGRFCLYNIARVGLFLRGAGEMAAIMSLEEPRPRGTVCSASAPTGGASARPKTFSDATFAAAISTRGITYGFWITKALCRTPRRISRISSTELPLNLFFMYRSRNDSRVPA